MALYLRHIERRLRAAFCDTPVVMLNGPRQPGKTTLAQSALKRNRPVRFIDKIFKGEISTKAAIFTPAELIQLVTAGGYPEALARSTERRRQNSYRAYLACNKDANT